MKEISIDKERQKRMNNDKQVNRKESTKQKCIHGNLSTSEIKIRNRLNKKRKRTKGRKNIGWQGQGK